VDRAELDRRFKYHAPDDLTRDVHQLVRVKVLEFAELLDDALPEGREKALAYTALEESQFWAHAAIAREIK
jgi:hypothetical protein